MKKKSRLITKIKAFYRNHRLAAWSMTAAILVVIILAAVLGIR